MKIPFLNLRGQLNQTRHDIEREFSKIIDHTAFVCGKNVKEFENKFSDLHEVKYTIGLSSGTAGNHLAMLACGILHGDEVIMPVNTFIATAEGVSLAGGKPVFVDIDEATYNIDVSKIEEAITLKTKAINPVHLYGQPAKMDEIISIAKKHNLYVIEDAAQAHLATYKGDKVGGLGDIASWSFYPGKNLGAWGEAGAVTTNNDKLYGKIIRLRNHGSVSKYEHDLVGHNYRMSEFQAAVLNVKANFIDEWTNMRRKVARKYSQLLEGVENLIIPSEYDNSKHVYHLFVIRVEKRDALLEYLNIHGVATGIHYPLPLHLTKAYQFLGIEKGRFPVAEKICNDILSIPIYPELTDMHIEYVANLIKMFYSKR
jgi:dTDP-4-amino-4,6-dideoxygalactose transaminase